MVFIHVPTQTEIDKFEVAILIDHQVLWFQISVNHFTAVKVLQSEKNLHSVQLDLHLRNDLLSAHPLLQFTTCKHGHDEEKSFICLIEVLHVANERILGQGKHPTLNLNRLYDSLLIS